MKELAYISKGKPVSTVGLQPLLLHPEDVLNDRRLSPQAKRALLADWASDARAVAGAPALRRLDSGAVIGIDVILGALARIDGRCGSASGNDDDDPPPAGAAALPIPERSRLRPAA